MRNKRARQIIQDLQTKKQPLENERKALWIELEQYLNETRPTEDAIRAKILAVQEKVKPLDALMFEAAEAGKLKSANGADMLLTDIEARATDA